MLRLLKSLLGSGSQPAAARAPKALGEFKRSVSDETADADDAADAAEQARRDGNAALRDGNSEQALAHYERFVAMRPSFAPAHVNRAFALARLGRAPEAEQAYRRALELAPADADAAFFLGLLLERQGRHEEAEALFRSCTKIAPDFEPGWLAVARLHESRGELTQACDVLRRASHQGTALPNVWHELARLLLRRREWLAALEAADHCLRLAPDEAQAHGMRSDALRMLRRFQSALDAAEAGVRRSPEDARVWQSRGLALLEAKRREEAMASLARAVELAPEDPEAAAALALGLIACDRHQEALAALEPLLVRNPRQVTALHNKALAMMRLLRYGEALPLLAQALAYEPDDVTVRFDRAMGLLAVGSYAQGWAEYECRLRMPGYADAAVMRRLPRLQRGQQVQGLEVLVTSEQGLGDTLQFLRYVPALLDRGASVELSIQPRLRRLISTPWPGCRLHDGENAVTAKCFVQLMSLPYVLGLDEPLQMSAPYVQADRGRIDHWGTRLRAASDTVKRRIGLAWAGNSDHPDDLRRSLNLELLRQGLQGLSNVQFVSLQLAIPEQDVASTRAWPELLLTGTEQRDMADTAALMELLDLVITVDTSLAHLAGTLGRPFVLMLQHCPDWRWGVNGDSTPWYPSAKLLRQESPGDWAGVIQTLKNQLGQTDG